MENGVYLGDKEQVDEMTENDYFVIVTNEGIRKISKSSVIKELNEQILGGAS